MFLRCNLGSECTTHLCVGHSLHTTFALGSPSPPFWFIWHAWLCHTFSKAVFSGYITLLPLTGIWYRISFQNLEEGERDGDGCESFPALPASSLLLIHVLVLWLVLRFFHQHTAPCFFLRWRTDSGNRASWAGVIFSNSTRTTCKAVLH